MVLLTVIIPVYNSAEELEACLNSLTRQNLGENYEVLIIDNNSADNTQKVIKEFEENYPRLIIGLKENEIQGSYAARNKGIKNAKGDVLAFIDADCTASEDWLKEGMKLLERGDVDLVGGDVCFTYPKGGTGSEVLDSSINMQIQKNVEINSVAKTANLFVRKEVFDTIGLFRETLKSGGDVEWTRKAVENGFNLCFGEKAFVSHPARPLGELLKKQHRVGKGQSQLDGGRNIYSIFKLLLGVFTPPRISTVKNTVDQDKLEKHDTSFSSVYLASWLSGSANNLGRLQGLLVGVHD